MELFADGLWADGLFAENFWLEVISSGGVTNAAPFVTGVAAVSAIGTISFANERVIGLTTEEFAWSDFALITSQGIAAESGTRTLLDVSDTYELVHIR